MRNFNSPRILKDSFNGPMPIEIRDSLLKNRIIILDTEIDSAASSSIIEQLLFLETDDSGKEIKMLINSPGGEINAGLAIYDVMNLISSPVSCICTGLAASMASVLFSSGKKRLMLPHSRLMIHDPLITKTGGSTSDIKKICDSMMETRKILAEILANNCGKTVEEIYTYTAADTYFTASESIEFGLADEILSDSTFFTSEN